MVNVVNKTSKTAEQGLRSLVAVNGFLPESLLTERRFSFEDNQEKEEKRMLVEDFGHEGPAVTVENIVFISEDLVA